MNKFFIAIIIAVVLGVAYYAISPLFNTIEVNDAIPIAVSSTQDNKTASGFESLSVVEQKEMTEQMKEMNNEEPVMMDEKILASVEELTIENPSSPVMDTAGHPAEGTVTVIDTTEGQIIRFEDFKTINGPSLHLYLSKDLAGDDFIDLGEIRGTSGNINYKVPAGVDLMEYKIVMHWCVPFGVLFNYAEINAL